MSVPDIYKGHHILASATQSADDQWEPHITIIPAVGSQVVMKNSVFKKYFPRRMEARQYGLAFAKRWIDHGRP